MARKDIINQNGVPNWDTIAGFKERLDGHDGQLAQIASNAKSAFSAKGDNTSDDTVALSNALNSNYSTIYLPDGTYKITDTMLINSGVSKKVIGSKNTVLSVQLSSSKKLIDTTINISFENITFDFNNSYVTTAINYSENLGTIRLRNLTIKNVKDMDNTTSTILINIPTSGNTVDIDNIEFNTLQKKGNGTIGDSGGNITGLLFADKTTPAPNNGTIKNIRVIEMHNIDASGNILFEDTSAIYLYSAYTGNDGFALLENIYGYNFGKRLLKIDSKSVNIRDVYAFVNTNDSLSAIGLLDTSGTLFKQKINVSNVQIYGLMTIGISVGVSNVNINNAVIDIQKPSMTGAQSNAFGIETLSANNVTINNVTITAERCILLARTDAVTKNITVSNAVLNAPSWGTYLMGIASGAYGFQNVTLQNVMATSTSTTLTCNFFDTTTLTGANNNQKGIGLNIVNCSMNYLGTTTNNYGLYLKNVSDVNIVNHSYTNDGVTKAYRGILADTCTNLRVVDFACNSLVQTAIAPLNCTNVRILGLTSPSSDFSVSVTNSTSVKLKDVDRAKVSLNDATSQTNTSVETDSSTGTTANRPINISAGHYYFDTTLNLPVWCKTGGATPVWIKSDGTTA